MVFVQGEKAAAFKHLTKESAIKEAKRLAKQTGKKAYILGTIVSFEIDNFKTENVTVDELPF